MTHIQLDDHFFDHPKTLSVGKDAKILAVAAICYSGKMLTDGFIPTGAISMLAASTGVTRPGPAIEQLVAARLWDVADGGFVAHDYLDYNSSAEKVRSNRDATKERMRRLRAQDVRANNDQTSASHPSKFDECAPNVRDSTTTTTSTSSDEDVKTPLVPLAEKPKRRHQLPDGWEPSDEHRQSLAAQGYSAHEIATELEKFRRHHWHKGDVGQNWGLAFTNWLERSREFGRPKAVPPPNGMPPEIARLPHNNATRLMWEQNRRDGAA